MLQLFEDQRTAAFTDNQAIAIFIKRARRTMRLIISHAGGIERIEDSSFGRTQIFTTTRHHHQLLTMFDRRLRLSQQVADEAREYFSDAVYDSIIPRNVTLGESPSFGRPVILHDVQSRGAQAYLDLAQEVIRREPTRVG